MKKRIIIIGIMVVICLGMLGGFASGVFKFEESTEKLQTLSAEPEIRKLSEETAERAQAVAEIAQRTDGWDSISKFNQMVQALNASVDNPIEYNDILYNYEYLRRGYHLSDAQMDYLADLIIDGYKPWDVLEICYFWLDTNEDISIIEKIYEQKWLFTGRTWIENAFNLVTDNKCGVLDEDDVDEYIKQGITFVRGAHSNIFHEDSKPLELDDGSVVFQGQNSPYNLSWNNCLDRTYASLSKGTLSNGTNAGTYMKDLGFKGGLRPNNATSKFAEVFMNSSFTYGGAYSALLNYATLYVQGSPWAQKWEKANYANSVIGW